MTGPEHYAAAEALLADARHAQVEDDAKRWLARAQVHAALALAAATAVGTTGADGGAWADVAGTKLPPAEPRPKPIPHRPGSR